MRVLVTGGAGFIGSHTVVELVKSDHQPIIFDNFVNSDRSVIKRLELLTGNTIPVIEGDVRSASDLANCFATQRPEAVIHFAGLKAVGDSVSCPLSYYETNISGTLNVAQAAQQHCVKVFIFSSSATVYGTPISVPIAETHQLMPTSPYGRSKLYAEKILADWSASSSTPVVALRYFNPIGAHPSGLIGEMPSGKPNNLAPYVCDVAAGKRPFLDVYGTDYETRDGTGERDYIDVNDLAHAHTRALDYARGRTDFCAFNIGTGRGTTVLEFINTFERTTGCFVPFRTVERRTGDVSVSIADPSNANFALGWKAERDLHESCLTMWNWRQKTD